ncbi:hypothetical protein [Streptomyces sp. DH10]|uniref:hypothetical protein n=1 Tax=Streptomyces sp. DH10 TaxID=3040121 RepID=UPI0024429972|nr:hypothetical protein [Streptomyces sp. DH10]MDG9708057.1 hypothetical protein [Streptomyces sp. DH10]
MGGTAKPRRRKAAAPSLQYERHAGKRRTGGKDTREKGEFVFGCLVFLCITGGIVLLAVVDMLWGDDTWQWAAEAWPGGAYAFAACLGVLAPCLVFLSVWSLSSMKWKSWKAHPARTLVRTGLGVTSAAALVPYVSLVFNAQDTGKWGRGRDTAPSWVFSTYPWLWAVGLLSTIVTITALVRAAFVINDRRRPEAEEATQPTEP